MMIFSRIRNRRAPFPIVLLTFRFLSTQKGSSAIMIMWEDLFFLYFKGFCFYFLQVDTNLYFFLLLQWILTKTTGYYTFIHIMITHNYDTNINTVIKILTDQYI